MNIANPAMRLTLTLSALLVAATGCDRVSPLSSGSLGSGTPEPNRDRGTVLNSLDIGKYKVEVRSYEAGRGSVSARFCDYWISFDGKPVDAAVALLLGFDVNHYNNCGTLLALKHPDYSFVLGAYSSSSAEYVPIFFGERDGNLMLKSRRDCALNSQQEGYAQAWKGWTVNDGQVLICNTNWIVSNATP